MEECIYEKTKNILTRFQMFGMLYLLLPNFSYKILFVLKKQGGVF